MSSSNQSFSDNGGAGKLLRKILLGKDLPIEPLQQQEWDFSKCTTWERARCWDYEIQRESKRARENTRQWREDFPKWVEQRLRDDQEDDALHLGLTRQDCEEMYDCPLPKWILSGFPEFPETPYLAIEKVLRTERLAQWGCTPREPRQVVPLDTMPVTNLLGELAKQSGLVNMDDLPPALESPAAHLVAWRTKIAEAFQKDTFTFSRHVATRNLGKGHFVTDVVLRIPWYESNKRLCNRFEAWLKKNRPEGARELGGSGSTAPGDWLKKLGAFRLLRHCRGNWQLAAEMSARPHPEAKALYENQATWENAAQEINDSLEAMYTPVGFDSIG